jgi:hypothetical protein
MVQAGMGITINITEKTDTRIKADFTIASNTAPGNRSVTVTANGQASNSVNFFVRAVPVNFRQVGKSDVGDGVLRFDYAWDSSSGQFNHLSECTVSESVVYPGTASAYSWPEPFPIINTANPTITSVPGSDGAVTDFHGLEGKKGTDFRKPYFASSFTAQQTVSYTCGSGDTALSGNLLGPLPIERSVNQNQDGSWKYTVTKPTNGLAKIDPLPD